MPSSAGRTGLSEACAHRLMKTLEEIGAVVRDKRGCYRPGMVLATLSKDVAIGDLIRATSEDAACATLAADLKGVVHVGVLENSMVTYAAKFGEAVQACRSPAGSARSRKPIAARWGKSCWRACRPQELEDFLYDGDFVALTPQTITTVGSLRSEIAAVRQRGLCAWTTGKFSRPFAALAPLSAIRTAISPRRFPLPTAPNLCRTWEEEVAGPSAVGRRHDQPEDLPRL